MHLVWSSAAHAKRTLQGGLLGANGTADLSGLELSVSYFANDIFEQLPEELKLKYMRQSQPAVISAQADSVLYILDSVSSTG